jgi:uncharacterized protein (DUF433 family)
LVAFHIAEGEDVKRTAMLYDLRPEQVNDAIAYENKLAA